MFLVSIRVWYGYSYGYKFEENLGVNFGGCDIFVWGEVDCYGCIFFLFEDIGVFVVGVYINGGYFFIFWCGIWCCVFFVVDWFGGNCFYCK